METGDNSVRFAGHDRFLALAHEQGLEVHSIRLERADDPANMKVVLRQIQSAQGFWIRDPVLLGDQRVRDAVEARLRSGAVAIAELNWQPQHGDDWFQHLGLEGTSVRAVRSDSLALDRFPHPMLVPVDRESYDYGFRDTSLFRGVNELLLQQASGVGCFGDAQVVLAVPSSNVQLLDICTDYFILGLPRPELPVVATSGLPDWRGQVIAFHVGIFHDPYQGPFGAEFPGIVAADNQRFAQNLLRVVSDGRPPVGTSWEDAYALINDIETGVARLTARILSANAGADWFDQCIPQRIREKCRARQIEESAGFPIAAYLDLIDYKAIWKENWSVFASLFDQHAPPASKTRSLHFLQEVNPLRALAAHPTKRLLGGLSSPTEDQMDLLRRCKATVASLNQLS